MTRRPLEIDSGLIQKLKDSGLNDLNIREAANVGFHYNMINRVADAFDYPVPTGKQTDRLAFLLNIMGKFARGSFAEPVWVHTAHGRIRPTEVERGLQQMLAVEGVTTRAQREAVIRFVTAQWHSPGFTPGRDAGALRAEDLPAELETYLKNLALSAYKITDEDTRALQDAGYPDDAIYEVTIIGAVAAALVGLEQLFIVLHGPASGPVD